MQFEAMDTEGIDTAVLFPTRGLGILTFPDQDPRFAAAMARAYNDWLHDFCSADPNRLLGAGMISVYDLDDALSETRRVAEEFGFRSVFLRSNIINGKNWYDPHYEPLWNLLEELNLPLGFHEASASRSRQAAEHFEPNFGLRRVYAQPFEQMMGMGAFLGGGILRAPPENARGVSRSQLFLVAMAFVALDEGFEREGDMFMPDLVMKPSDYFKRQCWISIEPDEAPARYTIAEFGCDQLVFSTDYPHGDSKYPNAVSSFLELDLPDEDKRKFFGTIARAFTAARNTCERPRRDRKIEPSTDPLNRGGTDGTPDRH